MKLKAFIDECRRRKVLSSVSIYAISAWVLIQVSATTFPYLGFPKFAVTAVIILSIVLFPVVILFSWFYNVVPDIDEDELEHDEETHYNSRKKNFYAIVTISSILGLAAIFLTIRLLQQEDVFGNAESLKGEQITVGIFENFTKDKDFDIIGKMAADWISHGIVQNQLGSVVDYETVEDYKRMTNNKSKKDDVAALSKIMNTTLKMIKGSYYRQGDQLIFQCRISDSKSSTKPIGFENIEVKIGEELKGIELLTQKILGYLSTQKDKQIDGVNEVPQYDAYQYYLEAKDVWSSNYQYAEELIHKALEVSPEFIQARELLMRLLYNTKQYYALDSFLVQTEQKQFSLDKNVNRKEHDKNQLVYFRSLLNGEHGIAYDAHRKMVKNNSSDLNLNLESMVTALEFVHKPADVLSIYSEISDSNIDFDKCSVCLMRVELVARTLLFQGDYRVAIKKLEDLLPFSSRITTSVLLVKAYARQGEEKKLNKFLDRAQKKLELDGDWRYLLYIASNEYYLMGNENKSKEFASKAVVEYEKRQASSKILGRVHYLNGNLKVAKSYFEEALNSSSSDTYSMAKLAQIYYKLGEKDSAEKFVDSISVFEEPFQFGALEYHKAQAYANMEQSDKALSHLKSAVQQGKRFNIVSFYHDSDMKNLIGLREFGNILRYWH